MSEPEKEKGIPRKNNAPPSKASRSQDKAKDRKPTDSDDIERAVYDGMQDLRVKRSG